MTETNPKRFPFAKAVIVMAVCFLVGLGLCGLDYVLGAHGYGQPHEEFSVGPLDGISLVVMALSFAGLVLSLIVWAVAAVVTGIGSGINDDRPIKPLSDDDHSIPDGKG